MAEVRRNAGSSGVSEPEDSFEGDPRMREKAN